MRLESNLKDIFGCLSFALPLISELLFAIESLGGTAYSEHLYLAGQGLP